MLAWVDIETTGLDPNVDRMLELGIGITDENLNLIDAESWVIKQVFGFDPQEWTVGAREMHERNGLIDAVRAATLSHFEVQRLALEFLEKHFSKVGKNSPMCGSSVHFDRAFIKLHMPDLDKWFHYRNIDCSTLKELVYRWLPTDARFRGTDDKAHRALDDLSESIREMSYYKNLLFKTANDPYRHVAYPPKPRVVVREYAQPPDHPGGNPRLVREFSDGTAEWREI